MREGEKKLVQKSFSSVRAYLANPEDLKKKIEALSKEVSSLEDFVEEFDRSTSASEDPTKKTDGRIFLNDIRGRLS